MLKLEGAVQHYEWGGYDFIPSLLGKANRARKPYAEYWLGAHPKAPATARKGRKRVPLTELAPDLPYLFKVLDARVMLSIQAHPSRTQAKRGFAAENAACIAMDAPNRNYRDENHKPEVHVALTPFWMLHGFRPWNEIAKLLTTVPEFAPLCTSVGDAEGPKAMRKLVRRILTMPRPDEILAPLLGRLADEAPSRKSDPGYWALRAASTFADAHRDPGLFFIYLLNLVHLTPGQGTYQPAGVLHAYLEGVNVELMANSDNVLRAGLTPKHIDNAELLKTISFEGEKPPVLKGESAGSGVRVYRTPSTEFELTRWQLPAKRKRERTVTGPAILLLLEGTAGVGGISLTRGDSVFATDETFSVETGNEAATFYIASVPAR